MSNKNPKISFLFERQTSKDPWDNGRERTTGIQIGEKKIKSIVGGSFKNGEFVDKNGNELVLGLGIVRRNIDKITIEKGLNSDTHYDMRRCYRGNLSDAIHEIKEDEVVINFEEL